MLTWWYSLVDFVLPFQWTESLFMKNALLAIILVTPLFGLLGTMVVSNRMAFFSDSIGHGAFTGIALGTVFAGVKPIWGAIAFSLVFALAITLIKHRSKASSDTVIGVFSSTAVAIGLVVLSFSGSFNTFSSFLVGDILSIAPMDLGLLALVFLGVVALWIFILNKVLLVSISESLASSRGVNTFLTEALFTCAIALVVTITIQWVGLLLINSLLVLPAAAARNTSKNVRQYHLFSVAISMFSGVLGLILSYTFNVSTGACIVLVAAVIFFATLIRRFL